MFGFQKKNNKIENLLTSTNINSNFENEMSPLSKVVVLCVILSASVANARPGYAVDYYVSEKLMEDFKKIKFKCEKNIN